MTPSPSTRNMLALIGRALLALLFIPAGFAKIAGFAATAGYIASKGLPVPQVLTALTIALELGVGILLLVGWQARWAALGLALFTLVVTPIFHNFWAMPPEQQMMQQQAFFKNLAITGGLLMVMTFGPGGFSLGGGRERA